MHSSFNAILLSAVVVFVVTNVDDIVLLSLFFADPKLRVRSIVIGQFIGNGLLVLVSVLAGLAAVAVPPGWASWLGIVPLLLGVQLLVGLVRGRSNPNADGAEIGSLGESRFALRSQVLRVAAVTVANGGDNLSVYIPLFAATPAMIPIYVGVFAAMTALWCALGFALVHNAVFGASLRRYGRIALPFVLIVLGIQLLLGARVLF